MTHADLDDLAALALDPADAPADVRRHVGACADCADLVASLADVRTLAGEGPLTPAPARVRAQVMAEVRAPAEPEDDVVRAMRAPVSAARARTRARIPAWAAGLAAGIALVAGLGLGRFTAADQVTPEAQPADTGTVVAAADLTALDSDAQRGVASAVRDDDMITLRVKARELGDEAGFHEVWLINVDGTRMVALGVLAEWDTGEFQVPRGLIDEGYRIVDISVEPDDGDPTHSGVSLARGELV